MKIEIEKNEIQRALSILSSVVDGTSTRVDDWGSVDMSFDGGVLCLAGTDGVMWLRVCLPYTGKEKAGAEYRVSLGVLSGVVGALSPGAVTMREQKARLVLEQGSCRLTVPYMDARPGLPGGAETQQVIQIRVAASALADGVKCVGNVMVSGKLSLNEVSYRDVVRLSFDEGNRLVYTATDGHRLAMTYNNLFQPPTIPDGMDSVVLCVYRKAALALRKFCHTVGGEIEVRISAQGGLFMSGREKLYVPNVSFDYPNVTGLLQGPRYVLCTVKRGTLWRAIEQVGAVFTAEKGPRIMQCRIVLAGDDANMCILSAKGEYGASAEVKIAIDQGDSDLTVDYGIELNPTYVAQALESLETADIIVIEQGETDTSPIYWHELGSQNTQHAIMPIRRNRETQGAAKREDGQPTQTKRDKDQRTPIDNVDYVHSERNVRAIEMPEEA